MGKVLLVIGASSDIGIGTIASIHEEYSMIIAHYNHMSEKLEELRITLGEKLICLKADLLDMDQVDGMIEQIQKSGAVPDHILHLPALPIQIRKFHKANWNIFQQQLDVSVKSLVLILQALLPRMVKRNGGRIIIMLSESVDGMPPKFNSDYVMVKYALLGLMKSLAVEYGDKGITVNGISPALVETKFVEKMHNIIIEEHAKNSPIGRNLQVEDVISTVNYLFSEMTSCVNGQNIMITCGRAIL